MCIEQRGGGRIIISSVIITSYNFLLLSVFYTFSLFTIFFSEYIKDYIHLCSTQKAKYFKIKKGEQCAMSLLFLSLRLGWQAWKAWWLSGWRLALPCHRFWVRSRGWQSWLSLSSRKWVNKMRTKFAWEPNTEDPASGRPLNQGICYSIPEPMVMTADISALQA